MIEAVQWLGEIRLEKTTLFPGWFCGAAKSGHIVYADAPGDKGPPEHLVVLTPGGRRIAKLNDYIVRGITGELYPVRRDSFEATYDPVQD